ncbi:MAG: YbjN domain-containing protein [Bacilli bacterium]|nr:YbjN domain-containing protein [Bacilli bacterium]
MNEMLERVYSRIKDTLQSLKFEVKADEENHIEIVTNTRFEEYKDDITIDIAIYDEGTFHIFFVFDQIEESLEVYRLINEFNSKSPWFSAYLSKRENDTCFLQVHGSNVGSENDETFANLIIFYLSQIIDMHTVERLRPLSELTH